MPSQNMPVQRIKVAILPLDLPCSVLVNHSGEMLTSAQSHNNKPDGLFVKYGTFYLKA
jgi:hypothetical protein